MEKIIDKFLRYVSIDTQSNESSESQPSSDKQLKLLGLLKDELVSMGVEAELDEYGYVMGKIPSNCPEKEIPAIGFIAHVDTSPDASGADILSLKFRKSVDTTAKMAYASVLGKDNALSLYENLYGVGGGDSKLLTNLLGHNDAAKLIDISYDTCGFHVQTSLSA